MLQHLRPALVMLALFTLLTGLAYPFALTRHRGARCPGPPTAASSRRATSSSDRA